MFELFSQAGRTLDRAQGGLGIGLTLVRRLTEMHGGSVEAASAGLGRGSTFTRQCAPGWRAQAAAGTDRPARSTGDGVATAAAARADQAD